MSAQSLEQIGFVGLGRMGAPMAALLARAGYRVTVYDVRREAARAALRDGPARVAESLSAVGAGSDAVITMLPNDRIVREVILGEDRNGADALAPAMSAGAMVIDMSSSSPLATRELAGALEAKEIGLVDAPVSGGVKRAKAGDLAIMAGGAPALIKRCRPLLEVLGREVFETGPLGSGHALKALNNVLSATGLIAAAEAFLIGTKFGLDSQVMLKVINESSGRNNSTENKFAQFILNRAFDSGFSLQLLDKDIAIAMDLACEVAAPALMNGLCQQMVHAARAQLPATADHTEIVKWLESLAQKEL
jgi:3-hydroxyisobutyrate dehydrogenase